MKVIKFPSSEKKITNLTPQKKSSKPLITGSWNFSCTNCDNVLEFKTETIVFKKIEFFCNRCGQHHIVGNPAFSENYENKKIK